MATEEKEIRKTIHDLNNVMAIVLGSAELIAVDAGEKSQSHEDAENIRDAALRGRALLDTLRRQLNLS